MAYSIGRRVGGSVDRNRLRRRLRAILDELASEIGAGDYLVSAGTGARQSGYRELKAMASNALHDLGSISSTAVGSTAGRTDPSAVEFPR